MIIGNMKMYMTYEEILNYINNVSKDVIVCPTTIYIPFFLAKGYKVGIQDISVNDLGAYTGEISAKQAKSLGVSYVIVGHSELRTNHNETDEIINKKLIQGLNNGLKVILCIGEKKSENINILKEQLLNSLKDVNNLDNVIIAYEPVWCIGTGITPTNEQIKTTIDYVKTIIKDNFNQNVTIIYGGSVDENNINNLSSIVGLSGFLIGKASTNVEKINKITTFIRQN